MHVRLAINYRLRADVFGSMTFNRAVAEPSPALGLAFSARSVNVRRQEGTMSQVVTIELDLPDDLAQFRLPAAVNARLRELLDRQDNGIPLKETERREADGLVELAELLTLLRLRVEGAARKAVTPTRP
jgi:hypothetical protein